MKIIAVGDFHGKFPKKLMDRIKKENADLIVSAGDFADTFDLRDLVFKHWNELGKEDIDLEKIIGKKKYMFLLKNAIDSMEVPMRQLELLKRPVVTVYGNCDFLDNEANKLGMHGFEHMCKKARIFLLRRIVKRFNDLQIAGFSGYRSATLKGIVKYNSCKKSEIKNVNKRWNNALKKLFGEIKYPERTIFLAHDMPYGYFDKIKNKLSPLSGKHVGDKYILKYIKKHKPLIAIGGHMHEYQGKKKLGKTMMLNPGAAYDGKAAIIEIDNYKIKKIKFIK